MSYPSSAPGEPNQPSDAPVPETPPASPWPAFQLPEQPIPPAVPVEPPPPPAGPPPLTPPMPVSPTVQVPPTQVTPLYEPTTAAYAGPVSAPPLAGYPGPVSGPPISGPPGYSVGYPQLVYPQSAPPAPAPAPPPRRGRALTVTALVVLLLLTGAAVTFSVLQTTQLSDTKERMSADLASREQTIGSRDDEITQLKKDLQDARDELAKTKQDLTGTQNEVTELKRQKSVISKCLELAAQRAATGRPSASEVNKVCNEMVKYLD